MKLHDAAQALLDGWSKGFNWARLEPLMQDLRACLAVQQAEPSERLWKLAEVIRDALDRASCPGAFLTVAWKAASEHIKAPRVSPEDEAEQFIQAAVDSAPEPLRRLGEYLAKVLSEDQWATAERMLLGAAAPLPKEGDEPSDWRTEAAAWLRRKAEEAKPAAAASGWANPAHGEPDRLMRLAEELDADASAAPYGMEPHEVRNKFGDALRPEWARFSRAMHSHVLGLAAPSDAPAPKAVPVAVKVERSFDYAPGSREWYPWIKVTFPAIAAGDHDSPLWQARDDLAASILGRSVDAPALEP